MARPACIANSHHHRACFAGRQDGPRRLGDAGQMRSLSVCAAGYFHRGTGTHLTPGTERQASRIPESLCPEDPAIQSAQPKGAATLDEAQKVTATQELR